MKKLLFHRCFLFSLLFLALFVSACGFHLRGAVTIPTEIRRLKLSPDDSFEPFQRALRQSLKDNGICLINYCDSEKTSVLILSPLVFSERVVAYGYDMQVNRVTLEMNFCYEVNDAQGRILIPKTKIVVSRDLTINPNAVLATESDRNQVKAELYQDAASQLIRQLANSDLCRY